MKEKKLKTSLVVSLTVDGYHCWPDAPEWYSEFKNRHRHLFKVICWLPQEDSNKPDRRQMELWDLRHTIDIGIATKYGFPAEFGNRSCEGIADEILCLGGFDFSKVFVGEETDFGAEVSR